MTELLTIVPPEPTPGQATTTQGTVVMAPSGEKIGGVQRIELVAELGGVWRARIECLVGVRGRIVAEIGGKPITSFSPDEICGFFRGPVEVVGGGEKV